MSNHTWHTKVAAVLGVVLLCAVPAAAPGPAVFQPGNPTIAWNAYLNVGIGSSDGKALSLYAWPVRVVP